MKCFDCNVPMKREICDAAIDETGCGKHTCPECNKVVHSKRGCKQ